MSSRKQRLSGNSIENYNAETKNLSDFFNNDGPPRYFKIPPYQRGYSWTKKHVIDFIGDLFDQDDNKQHELDPYFLGIITVIKDEKNDEISEIIDGQQRITTCMILLICIWDILREMNSDSAPDIKRQIFNNGDEDRPKLTLDNIDDPFFKLLHTEQPRDAKIKNLNDERTTQTHLNILNAYKNIRIELKDKHNYFFKELLSKGNSKECKEYEKKEKKMLSYGSQKDILSKEYKEKSNRKKKLNEELKLCEEESNRKKQLNGELNDLSKKLKQLNCKLKDLDEKLKRLDGELKSLRKIIEGNEWVKHLKSYRDTLRDDFKVSILTVKKTHIAYALFDRMNERGVKLDYADLAKSLILSKIHSQEDNVCQALKDWHAAESKMGRKKSTMKTFLHNYLIAFHSITILDLYGKLDLSTSNTYEILEKILVGSKGRKLLDDICDKVNDYVVLKRLDKKKHDISPTINNLESLNILQASTVDPVLMVAFKKYQKEDFEHLTDLVLKWFFRVKTIGDTHAGAIGKELANMAHEMKNDQNNTVNLNLVREKLMSTLYTSDADFESDLHKFKFENNPVARYVLKRIEEHEYPEPGKTISDDITVEHIMPEDIAEEPGWVHTQTFHKEYLKKLGNLTLLDGSGNSGAGNSPFHKKCEIYKRSGIQLTKHILDYGKKWDADTIQKRQNDLVGLVKEIWSLSNLK